MNSRMIFCGDGMMELEGSLPKEGNEDEGAARPLHVQPTHSFSVFFFVGMFGGRRGAVALFTFVCMSHNIADDHTSHAVRTDS